MCAMCAFYRTRAYPHSRLIHTDRAESWRESAPASARPRGLSRHHLSWLRHATDRHRTGTAWHLGQHPFRPRAPPHPRREPVRLADSGADALCCCRGCGKADRSLGRLRRLWPAEPQSATAISSAPGGGKSRASAPSPLPYTEGEFRALAGRKGRSQHITGGKAG
jgi:hypothetical protein